jgi:SSS family transporter
MNVLTKQEGWTLLIVFGLVMFSVVWLKTRKENNADEFLVAGRVVPLWHGAMSIAVSWIWAPAIFICSMQAYSHGLPGVFWFIAPNILCFFIFAPLAVRLRRLMPYGYTMPEFIIKRYAGNKSAHLAFLTIFFGYQLGAIVINCLAGGALLHAVSGLDFSQAIIGISIIALAYSLFSGLKASIFTDIIQMIMVLLITFILVPWAVSSAGGIDVLRQGLAGIDGKDRDLLDPRIAFTIGIPMTLSLLAGPFGDQMFFQRAMAVREKDIVGTFVLGGILFGFVPIVLSLLGFIGVVLAKTDNITVSDPQMIGPIVIAHLLPAGALYAFCLMAFAGLCSTLDSAYCAISSLVAVDVYRRYCNQEASDKNIVRISRVSMVVLATVGTLIALLQPRLLWVFLIYGALVSAGMFPCILSVYWSRLTANGVVRAIWLSLLIGLPMSIYANVKEDPYVIVLAAIFSVSIGLIVCVFDGMRSKESYKFLDESPIGCCD